MLTLLFACSDQSIGTFNAEPTAAITSHVDEDEVLEGDEITVRGSVSDADDATEDLVVSWFVGDGEECVAETPDDDGGTECTLVLDPDNPRVTLEVTDPSDATTAAWVDFEVVPTAAPTAEITSPLADDVLFEDEKIVFEGIVADEEDAPQDLDVDWKSDLDDWLDDVDAIPDNEGDVIGYGYLSAGEHALTLYVEDKFGKTGTDTIIITVNPPNDPPSCSLDAADPTEGETGDTVVFTGTVGDDGTPVESLSIDFSSNVDGELGETTASSDGSVTFSWAAFTPGAHTVTMTVEDQYGEVCTDTATHTSEDPAPDDYSGTYLHSGMSYSCAYGLVSMSSSSFIVTDSNPTIAVYGGGSQPGTMSGSFSTDTEFTAVNTLPGTCTETYTVTGEFIDAYTMESTLTATYTGGTWCFDCTNQSWSFTASR